MRMPNEPEPLDRLEAAIHGLRLQPQEVLVNKQGDGTVAGFLVIIRNPLDLIELMRRTRDISAEFVPSEVSDNAFIIYIRS